MVAVPIVEGTSKPMGILFAVMDATWLSDITDMIGYGKKRYSYVINGQGAFIAHPNRDYVLQQRNFIEEAKTHKDFTRLAAMLTKMTKGETGYDEYPFGGADRIFGYAPIPETSWSLAVGAYTADVFKQTAVLRFSVIVGSLFFTVIGIILILLIARTITRPINQMVRTLNEIISGDVTDLSKRIEVRSFDETGQMAELVNRTFEKVAALVKEMLVGSQNGITGSRNIGQITAEVASGMNEMAIGARQITTFANRVNEISRTNNESIETMLAELRRFKV